MMSRTLLLSLFVWLLMLLLPSSRNLTLAAGGKWDLLQSSVGISAMHMQLLHNDKVVMYDRTDFGESNISLPNGNCRIDPFWGRDCTAHSVEYDVAANSIRPLMVLTNVWCSSGSVFPNGSLIQTGGTNEGERVVRLYNACDDNCDWQEIKAGLFQSRWYSTNHMLPDGKQIIIGGRGQANYEYYPKVASADQLYPMPFLSETTDANIENNLYPFVFLNVDGNLFIFANNRAILFDYKNRVVVTTYPQIPGGDPRSYPSTGSAVLLPLRNLQASVVAVEVLVCGGAPKGSYVGALNGNFVKGLNTCARISVNDPNPQWAMETMPLARVMGDMVLLPNGNVLIINGAGSGAAGWELGREPVLSPVIYKPNNPVGSRFEVQNPSTIPRMYHSTAGLLRDGRVLVGGSNPHDKYEFTGVLFPTELSLEAFSPSYLDPEFANLRPRIISPVSQISVGYSTRIRIQFTIRGALTANSVRVTLLAPPFNTHSFSMNQRILELTTGTVTRTGLLTRTYVIDATTPTSGNFAPSGYYLIFVVHQDIPSEGIWIKLQ